MSAFDDPAFFGEMWADTYDQDPAPDPAKEVDFLAGLATGGRVLELAIGTGRVGIPLAARGVAVEGVEGSAKMVARMREKPGGKDIPVTIGDMADVPVEGPFQLVYLVYNTLANLLEAERQAACLRNVAKVLSPDGAFVVQIGVPNPAKFDQGRGAKQGRVEVLEVTENSARIEIYSYDAAAQRFISQTISFDSNGMRMWPHAERLIWPSELDLMARQAGLQLAERYADWNGTPFGSASESNVSIYRPA
jgi:SAM-dependent methyltransferase